MAAILNSPLKRKRPWHKRFGSATVSETGTEIPAAPGLPSELIWNSVCTKCSTLFDVRTRESSISHHYQWEDLYKSAMAKCYICLRICSYLEKAIAQDQTIRQEGLMPLSCSIDGTYRPGELARLTFTTFNSSMNGGSRYSYDFIAIQDQGNYQHR